MKKDNRLSGIACAVASMLILVCLALSFTQNVAGKVGFINPTTDKVFWVLLIGGMALIFSAMSIACFTGINLGVKRPEKKVILINRYFSITCYIFAAGFVYIMLGSAVAYSKQKPSLLVSKSHHHKR